MIIACLLDQSLDRVDLQIIDRLVPEVGKLPPRDVRVRVFKQHRPDFDLFPRVIYNVRDGRDALISAFKYASRALEFTGSLSEFVVDRSAQVFGFWNEHVEAALKFKHRFPDRIQFVQYESMRRDPATVINSLARFLGISIASRRIEQIVDMTTIDRVRKNSEDYSDPRYRYTLQKGQVGGWIDELSGYDLRVFEGISGPTLKKLGY